MPDLPFAGGVAPQRATANRPTYETLSEERGATDVLEVSHLDADDNRQLAARDLVLTEETERDLMLESILSDIAEETTPDFARRMNRWEKLKIAGRPEGDSSFGKSVKTIRASA